MKKDGNIDQCDACGKAHGNILGDINTHTHEHYGSLCTRCYKLVQGFGDDLTRIRQVLIYLERTRIQERVSFS